MTDRNRTLLAMAIGALIVVGMVAGFSIAEHGWGGDDDAAGASSDMTYCPALNAPVVSPGEAPSLVADDVEVVVEAAHDGDGHRGDQVVLVAAERVAGDAATRCGVGENLPYF